MRAAQHMSDFPLPAAPADDRHGFAPIAAPSSTAGPVIRLQGRIGPATVMALHRHLSQDFGAGRSRAVVDLAGVTGIGTRTLTLLRGALRQLSHQGATIAIVGGDPGVRRDLELSTIRRVKPCPTPDPALLDRAPASRGDVV